MTDTASGPPPAWPPPRPPFPGLIQALLLVVLIWVCLILVAVGVMVVYALSGRDLEAVPTAPVMILSNSVGFFMVLVLGTWMARAPLRRLFPFRRFDPRILAPLVLVTLASFPILAELDALLRLIPVPGWLTEILEEVDRTMLDMIREMLLASAVALVVVAPVTEEFFFRGLVLHGFLGRYGRRRAIWASALIFAVAHLTLSQFLPALLIGLFLGWLMAATRSLWLPLIVHALVNGVSVALVGLGFEELGPAEASPLARIAVTAVSAAAVAGGLVWMRRLLGAPARPV